MSLAAQSAPRLADMEPVLARVAAWDPAQARDPLFEFTNFLRAALNSKSELPQIEARLLRMLAPDSKSSTAGKEFVCRQLSLIGTDASVPVLARLLNDPAMAEMQEKLNHFSFKNGKTGETAFKLFTKALPMEVPR